MFLTLAVGFRTDYPDKAIDCIAHCKTSKQIISYLLFHLFKKEEKEKERDRGTDRYQVDQFTGLVVIELPTCFTLKNLIGGVRDNYTELMF